MPNSTSRKPVRSDLIAGTVLIIVGIVFWLNQFYALRLGIFSWPLFVIVPGVLAFVFALSLEEKSGKWLAHAGSIITMAGLLLLYQNTFRHFQSWAYAWALVLPTSIGIGQVIFGSLKNSESDVVTGKRFIKYGLTLFALGFVFFELIIGISGFGLNKIVFGTYLFPALLIALGVFFLFRGRGSSSDSNK